MREKYLATVNGLHIAYGNLFGSVATETAYGKGKIGICKYGNTCKITWITRNRFCKNIPKIKNLTTGGNLFALVRLS